MDEHYLELIPSRSHEAVQFDCSCALKRSRSQDSPYKLFENMFIWWNHGFLFDVNTW